MIITARFDGRCASCGKPTPKGSEIDYVDRKAYHVGCVPNDSLLNDADQHALADKLGFTKGDHDNQPT